MREKGEFVFKLKYVWRKHKPKFIKGFSKEAKF